MGLVYTILWVVEKLDNSWIRIRFINQIMAFLSEKFSITVYSCFNKKEIELFYYTSFNFTNVKLGLSKFWCSSITFEPRKKDDHKKKSGELYAYVMMLFSCVVVENEKKVYSQAYFKDLRFKLEFIPSLSIIKIRG